MELIEIPFDVAHAGLRALKSVALADGEFHDLEQRLLQGVQTSILKTNIDVEPLAPITPADLAAAVTEPELRERILNGCIITALIDGETSNAELELLEQYAQALDVPRDVLKNFKRLIDHNLRVLRINLLRRSFIGQRGRAYLADQGIRGFVRTLRGLLGKEDAQLAARYHALADQPRGTLGREYFEFTRANGFSLPGEKDGPPEVIVFHDCLHVLAGYQTSSIEETQIAAFQAGMLKKDPIFGLFFMLAQFHLGVQITPVAEPQKLVADPQLMLEAFARGTRVNRNMCVDWTPQDDFERSVEELRLEYNIEPRVTSANATPSAA